MRALDGVVITKVAGLNVKKTHVIARSDYVIISYNNRKRGKVSVVISGGSTIVVTHKIN